MMTIDFRVANKVKKKKVHTRLTRSKLVTAMLLPVTKLSFDTTLHDLNMVDMFKLYFFKKRK